MCPTTSSIAKAGQTNGDSPGAAENSTVSNKGTQKQKNDGRRAAAMAVLLSHYDNPQHPENAATDFSATKRNDP